MVLPKAIRMLVKRNVLALALLILAVGAAGALAATLSGDGTLVGTPQNDTINAGNADDTVWGLAGSDTINVGNGNDMVDGDGNCSPGVQGNVYPNGLPSGSNYCGHGQQDQNGQNDTINAGSGNDTIFGGGGHNKVNVGSGKDTIYGGPIGDTINTGANGHPTIYLGAGGGNTVNTGTMASGVVYAQNGQKDTINCKTPSSITVYADKHIDVVNGCAKVIYTAPARARDISTVTRTSAAKHAIKKNKNRRHLRRASATR